MKNEEGIFTDENSGIVELSNLLKIKKTFFKIFIVV